MRKFEKISFAQFKKDIIDSRNIYDNYMLPKRSTKNSAGYDFFAIKSLVLKPGEVKKIPTGVKVYMNSDNPSNEGHIWISLQNHGLTNYNVKEGEAIAQGIFMKYYTIDNEEKILNERTGGIGSTNKEG